MIRFLISCLLLLILIPPAFGAPPKPRPYTGSGFLVIRPLPSQEAASSQLVLYREPGLGRIAEKAPAEFPLLSQIMETTAGEYAVAVMGKRGEWLKIAYDDAGREGWLALERRWEYIPWEEFLPGRTVRLLPWLRKEYMAVRREPSPSAGEIAPLSPEMSCRSVLIEGDWLRVNLGQQSEGWLRWRDEGGRFLISVREGGIR